MKISKLARLITLYEEFPYSTPVTIFREYIFSRYPKLSALTDPRTTVAGNQLRIAAALLSEEIPRGE